MSWAPVTESVTERVADFPVRAMAATLSRPEDFTPGTPLPPLWHWFHCLKLYPMAEAGADGHQALGHFLPDLGLPRRMWAGGRFTFHRMPVIGSDVTRTSMVSNVAQKEGRSGPIAFVTVSHRWTDAEGAVIDEEQDVVYRRADAPAGATVAAPEGETLSREMRLGPVDLFRYSALTFNGHRIHYDRDFCAYEGYDGLVVHGPLLATLLLDLLRIEGARWPQTFQFRAMAPVTADRPFTLCATLDGNNATLWIRRHDGVQAMSATATLRP